jgi:RNA polymerase sigma-70 factor (ECF subfamily)
LVTTSDLMEKRAPASRVDATGVLLAKVSQGDRRAFDDLYGLVERRVFGLVIAVLRDHEQSREVVQEVFLQLWQQAERFDGLRGSGEAWILHLAHSRAVDRVRLCHTSSARDARYAALGHVPDTDTVVWDVMVHDQQATVRSALARLTPGQRESIVLAYYSGMTTQEISDHIGVKRATVKTRIRDGLRKLHLDLGPAAVATL